MFKQFAREMRESGERNGVTPPVGPHELFLYHPVQLAGLLETAWQTRFASKARPMPVPGLPTSILQGFGMPAPHDLDNGDNYRRLGKVVFDHLIYAYMIESTRIYEIFRLVLYHFLHGERLEVPSEETQQWIRTTEELFYRDTPPFFAFQLTSHVRPDIRASRRNAYYRMFGMDLPHGFDDGRPYPYEKPAAANRDFVSVFERFLAQVWLAITNVTNTSGPRATDDWAIADLAGQLSDMLRIRRQRGNLSREEFFFVATMSWMHLTVESNESPLVKDLKAEGENAAERLRKIGGRVGLQAHSKARDFFSLADPMSRLLIAVEADTFDGPEKVKSLYAEGSPLRNDVGAIITDWSSATGRNMKAEPVVAVPVARSVPAPTAVPASNGAVSALMTRT